MSLFGLSFPNFALGPILILLFAIKLGLLPVSGAGSLANLVLPAITMGGALAAILTRMVRTSMLEELSQDYIRTARAKGLPERTVVYRHALRNAMIPILTVLGLQFGALLAGAIVTETIFAWPGIGRLTIQAISQPRLLPGTRVHSRDWLNLCSSELSHRYAVLGRESADPAVIRIAVNCSPSTHLTSSDIERGWPRFRNLPLNCRTVFSTIRNSSAPKKKMICSGRLKTWNFKLSIFTAILRNAGSWNMDSNTTLPRVRRRRRVRSRHFSIRSGCEPQHGLEFVPMRLSSQ